MGYPYCRGRIFESLEKDNGQYNDSRPIFWASGACFFVRKKTFNTLNGFDESFFAHMEEIDFCWRAHNAGFGVTYTGNSTVYHVGGASLSKTNSKKTFYNFRNSLFALTKNSNHPLFIVVLMRLILDGVAGASFLFSGKGKHTLAIIKAHIEFYGALPKLIKFRTQQQRVTYVGEKSIVWSYFIKRKKVFLRLRKH